MERHKTLFLVFLVVLSLFLSYKLIFDKPQISDQTIDVDETEIICYKRMYMVNPNRELLRAIPNKEINELIVSSLVDASPNRLGDKLISNELDGQGFLILSAFDVPVGMLFACFKEKLPRLEFESFDRAFISNNGKILLQTDKGVFEFASKYNLPMPIVSEERYVDLDDRFMPTKLVDINSYAEIVNPVESYITDDRQQIANGFLKKEVAEIREDDSYLYASSDESLRIFENGDIHYLSVDPQVDVKPNLHETLKVLRAFIKKVPVNFSNYRIVSLYESEDNTLIYLANSSLPFFASNGLPITVNISGGKVTSFYYNSKYLKKTNSIFVAADANDYRNAFKDNSDPFLIYTEDESEPTKAILSTMSTR